jgi:hypothetical protein
MWEMALKPERRTTMSQKGMLGTLPLSKVLGPVSSLVEAIASEQGREVLEELKKFNRKEPCWGTKSANSDFVARAGNCSAVRLGKRHDPKEFYQDGKNLFVWPDFISRIVSVAQSTKAGENFQEASFGELKKTLTGEMLQQAHPDDVWSATDFCAWLSAKLAIQPNGGNGELLNTGYANLFLVEGVNKAVFVVHVHWGSDDRGWYVDAWGLGYEWYASRRFFSKPPIAL